MILILDLGLTTGSVKTKAGRGDKAKKGRSERMAGPKMVQSHYEGFPLLIIGGEIWSWSLLNLT